jgi:hypothetical protein
VNSPRVFIQTCCIASATRSQCVVVQGPSELLKAKGRRVVPKKSELKRGPSGVPYWGTETVRVDKALSKKLHHKTVTEVRAASVCVF